MKTNVVITGLSCATAYGLDVVDMLRGIESDRMVLRAEYGHVRETAITNVGIIDREQNALKSLRKDERNDFCGTLLTYLAARAFADAGLAAPSGEDELPLILASCYGNQLDYFEIFQFGKNLDIHTDSPAVRDLKLLRFREDAITLQLARHFGCSVRKFCVGMQCASSILAISTAVCMIEDGREDYVLVGAYDFFEPATYYALHAAGVIDATHTDPYSVRHNGFNVADGAGFLVLESEEAACKRGAKRIYARIRASALACESTEGNPSVRRVTRVVEECLKKADLKPSDLGLISPHGCGVPAIDRCESIALRRALGPCVDEIPFAYFTNYTGYAFAASAFLDLAALLTGMQSGHWPKGCAPSEPEEVSRFRFLCQPEPCGHEENILKLKIGYSGAAGALILTGVRP